MKHDEKRLHEKMIDYSRYGAVMLAVSVFFYLGLIIPSELVSEHQLNALIGATVLFLVGSIFFFNESKICKKLLVELEENQNNY
ncbi:YrhC family protein [Neobacillus sp. LXY-4]|uniref:YrhC family protein n=1 Tax=Neobacillus sp. LXY-4 TaxID=3379826 RepID=UPI003EDEC7BA